MGAPRTVRGGGSWRRRGPRAAFVALTALAVVIGQQAPARADDPLQEALRRKQDLERAVAQSRADAQRYVQAANRFQAAVTAANARITTLAADQEAAQSEADALKLEIQISEEELALVAFQIDQTKAEADSLGAQADAQEKLLADREDLYARRLRLTYQQALVSPLEMLLSSSSLMEFASRVQAMILVSRQDRQLADEIRALRADTADKLSAALDAERQIAGLQAQIEEQRRRLGVEKARYEELVAQAREAIDQQAAERANAAESRNAQLGGASAANKQTAALTVELERASALYEQLAAAQAAGSGLGAFSGKFSIWPLRGPITSGFGPRWGSFHNGLDIAAPMYTPIKAPASGRVTTVGKPYLAYGDTAEVVIIAHGNNASTLYGHLDDRVKPPPVRVGQYVTVGETIGFIGVTGWTTGPHVHFTVISNGRAVNPLPYLP